MTWLKNSKVLIGLAVVVAVAFGAFSFYKRASDGMAAKRYGKVKRGDIVQRVTVAA